MHHYNMLHQGCISYALLVFTPLLQSQQRQWRLTETFLPSTPLKTALLSIFKKYFGFSERQPEASCVLWLHWLQVELARALHLLSSPTSLVQGVCKDAACCHSGI